MTIDEVTPGGASPFPCPRCRRPIIVTMTGGPHDLRCDLCGAAFSLDVVHDGIRWTIRRVRWSAEPP